MTKEESELVRLNHGTKRFINFDNEDKKRLAKSLVSMCYFVGIKDSPSIEQLKMLVNFICVKFPTISLQELEKAFMNACSGQYGDVEHYQNFSPIYVAKILGMYIKDKNSAISKYNQLNDKKLREEEAQEKNKKYDPIQGAINVLFTEYQKFIKIKTEQRVASDFEMIQSDVAMRVCQSVGLFKKYDPKTSLSIDYLSKKFVTLPSDDENKIKEILTNYVRSHGKGMER